MTGTFRSRPSAAKVKASGAYQKAITGAQGYLDNQQKLGQLLEQAADKAQGRSGKLGQVWESFTASLRLVKAYAKGHYKGASTKALLLIVAALLYFVMPTDLIPDFLLGLGLIDDAAILAWTLQTLSGEIDQFKVWEAEQEPPPSKTHDAQ